MAKGKDIQRKTVRVRVLFTPEEAEALRRKASGFQSVSNYVRCALKEFSDVGARHRLGLIAELKKLHVETRDRLGWAGANLNQAMRRSNELAAADMLSPTQFNSEVMPAIESLKGVIDELKVRADNLFKMATDNGLE